MSTPPRSAALAGLTGLALLAAPALAGAQFSPARTVVDQALGARAVHAADLDGDGRPDALTASGTIGPDQLAWHANTGGGFGPQRILSGPQGSAPFGTPTGTPLDVLAADLDGDGDRDVLAAFWSQPHVAWFENQDGAGTFGAGASATTSTGSAVAVVAVDLDGDGDRDVLAAAYGLTNVVWLENTDGAGTLGVEHVLPSTTTLASDVVAADVDGDGDFDVVASSSFDDTLTWFANTDGLGTFGPGQPLPGAPNGPEGLATADLDADGDADVLCAGSVDDTIAWHANGDGLGGFGPAAAITTAADGARALVAEDLDGDGAVDVLAASSVGDEVAWYRNVDGLGAFDGGTVVDAGVDRAWSVFAADVDGDGDPEAFSAAYLTGEVAWYDNADGAGSFGSETLLTASLIDPAALFAADLDGDGDHDALTASASDAKAAWYDNTDGAGAFGAQQLLPLPIPGAATIRAADLDGDGDQDVYAGGDGLSALALFLNAGGPSPFGATGTLATASTGVRDALAADLDQDGDLDLLYTDGAARVAWFPNLDGLGGFGAELLVTTAPAGPRSLASGDLDGDGDLDVLVASQDDDTVAWYDNLDGVDAFSGPVVLTAFADGAQAVVAQDLDGDGDTDVLAGSQEDDTVRWFENTDGLGSFAETVISTSADGVASVCAASLDADADHDVIAASTFGGQVAWFLNLDGQGTFVNELVIDAAAAFASSVLASDLDGDGDQDVLVASRAADTAVWYENFQGGCATSAPSTEALRLGSPPNPAVLLPGLTTGPVIGANWDPFVDHTTFEPQTVYDLLGIGLAPANAPAPGFGTLLVDPSSLIATVLSVPFGGQLSVPIPPKPCLVGFPLYTQAGAVTFTGVSLTNALDITIGVF